MRRYAVSRQASSLRSKPSNFFVAQAIEDVVDNDEQGAGPGEVIEEPEFQPEVNQVDDNQIGEPPQPKPNILKFNGRLYLLMKQSQI